jgi:hypothetical protein
VDDFYRVVAILGAVIILVSALWTVVRLHREHPLSPVSILIAAAGTAISLVIYILIVDIELKQWAVWGLLGGGALVGVFFGMTIPVYRRGNTVLSRAAGWHLALPPMAIAAFQVMGVRQSVDGIILSYAALYAATAMAVAACAVLLIRRLAARPAAAPASVQQVPQSAAPQGQCPHCGSPVGPNSRFCTHCGAPQ